MPTRPHRPSIADAHPEGVDDQRVDEFITRNRDALNQSIVRSREEAAKGRIATRTPAEIVEDWRRRRRQS